MNPLSIVGAFIITLSFLAYGIGSISLLRFKLVSNLVLVFLTLGVLFDIAAVVFMILGARGTTFTWHGILGYSAFTLMLADTVWVWRTYFIKGLDAKAGTGLIRFASYAYVWWVLAYFTGSLMVLWR